MKGKIGRSISISPLLILLIVSVAIFISHIIVMITAGDDNYQLSYMQLIFDSVIQTALIFPLLFIFVFRPLLKQITALEEAQLQVIADERKFHDLVKSMNEGFVVQNNEGIITFANDRFCTMLGLKHEEIIGHRFQDFLDSKNYLLMESLLEQIYNKPHISSEIAWGKNNHQKISTLVSPSIILNEAIKSEGSFLVVTDISSRKELELELIDAKEKAQSSNKLKSEFLAQMSHEVRTPINVILNVANSLKEVKGINLGEDLYDELEALDSASRRIVRSIDLILNLSEIESGNYSYNKEQIEIQKDLLIPLYNKFKILAANKGLDFYITFQTDDLEITADKFSVEQIFMNLIDNAIKFTENGGVAITVFRNNLNELCVEVLDTGIGISKEYQSKMFELFAQEDHGYSRRYEGTGLGLALVKKYCELNRMKISFESYKGKGTVFTVVFNTVV